MENEEVLETSNETENVDTDTTEENQEGIELTDTAESEETTEVEETLEENKEVKKTFRELLNENPEYLEEYQKDMDKAIKTRLNRKEKEFQRELSKYIDTENVLKSALGGNDITEINEKLRRGYEEQGIELPEVYKPGLSQREIEVLAHADAEDIIEEGYDAMVEEANRLAGKEYKNLNDREKVIFNTLAEKLTEENNKRELKKLGAKDDLLKDEDFISFRKQFNTNTPMEVIYSLYKNNQPKPKVENPGSMKSTNSGPKDFISEAEYDKMTREEVRENLDLIEKSMPKW